MTDLKAMLGAFDAHKELNKQHGEGSASLLQEFRTADPDGTIHEIYSGLLRTIIFTYWQGKLVRITVGETQQDANGRSYQCRAWAQQEIIDTSLGSVTAASRVWISGLRMLHISERELEGMPDPAVHFRAMSSVLGVPLDYLINAYDKLADAIGGLGGYLILRTPQDDCIRLGWQRREFLRQTVLTEEQVQARVHKHDAHMEAINATLN